VSGAAKILIGAVIVAGVTLGTFVYIKSPGDALIGVGLLMIAGATGMACWLIAGIDLRAQEVWTKHLKRKRLGGPS
jgi:hypothetical protein